MRIKIRLKKRNFMSSTLSLLSAVRLRRHTRIWVIRVLHASHRMNEANQFTLLDLAVPRIVDDVFYQPNRIHGQFQQLVTLFAVVFGERLACGNILMSEIEVC